MRVSLIKHQTNQVTPAAVPACSLSWHWSHIRDSDSMKPIGNEIQSKKCRSVGNNNKKEKKGRRCHPHGVLVCTCPTLALSARFCRPKDQQPVLGHRFPKVRNRKQTESGLLENRYEYGGEKIDSVLFHICFASY